MTFAEPNLLWFLILIPLIAVGAFLAERQRTRAWHTLVAERLRPRLAAPSSRLSRWLSLGCGLLGCVLLIIALAQPIAGERETSALVRGRNIIIAIDASRSMLTKDVAPDRLTAAKTAAFDILDRFPGDRIGLLAFAGTATLQAPLTIDHNALRETLDQLNVDNVPTGGSNLAEAVRLAVENFRETGQKTHGLIVLSDGELHEGELSDATFDARQAGVFVVSIGIGTRDGDFVPDAQERDGRFRDRSGKAVLSRLNATPLRNLADSTQGLYLEGVGAGFGQKIDTVLERLDAFEDEGRVQFTPIARYSWFLIPAMILLIASLLLRLLWSPARPRGVPAATALLTLSFLLLSQDRAAAFDNPLNGFLGTRALQKGDPSRALDYYRKALAAAEDSPQESDRIAKLKYGEGTALYRLGDYPGAGQAFGGALLNENANLRRDSHHQLANSLYMRTVEGEKSAGDEEKTGSHYEKLISNLEDALSHYDNALKIDVKHEATTKNREITENLLEELRKKAEEKQQQEQEEQQQDPQEGGEPQEPQDEEGEPEDGEQQEGEDGQPQEQEDGSGEASDQEGTNQPGEPDGESGEQQGDQQPGEGEEPGSEPNGDLNDFQEGNETPGDQNPGTVEGREDESAEDFARRTLEENADLQREGLRRKGQQIRPNKDW